MQIRALIMDVDGTLTDGGIYIDNSGNSLKRFNVKDGYAIRNILPKYNIIPIIITGKQSNIVDIRCKELGIDYCIQNSSDKVKDLVSLTQKLDLNIDDIAYIGDDLNDLEVMKIVGLKGCPSDASQQIKDICNYVCKKDGGNGAVREFIEWIINI